MPVRTRDRVFLVILLLAALGPLAKAGDIPAVLGLKEQAAVYDGWLSKRLDKLLPELMRREKIDMWLVICEEYNEDPVYLSLAPFASLSARRLTMLVMFDRGGDKGVERFSVNRYGLGRLFPTVWKANQEDQWQALARAIKERDPKRIGIDESDVFAFGDGLSASKKARLVQAIGPDYVKRLVGAERLAVGWLERRLPEEIEVYDHICAIAHAIIAEAFSSKVMTPGVTTVRRRRVVDLGEVPLPRPDDLVQSRHLRPAAQVQPAQGQPRHSPGRPAPLRHRHQLPEARYGHAAARLCPESRGDRRAERAERRPGQGQPAPGHPPR